MAEPQLKDKSFSPDSQTSTQLDVDRTAPIAPTPEIEPKSNKSKPKQKRTKTAVEKVVGKAVDNTIASIDATPIHEQAKKPESQKSHQTLSKQFQQLQQQLQQLQHQQQILLENFHKQLEQHEQQQQQQQFPLHASAKGQKKSPLSSKDASKTQKTPESEASLPQAVVIQKTTKGNPFQSTPLALPNDKRKSTKSTRSLKSTIDTEDSGFVIIESVVDMGPSTETSSLASPVVSISSNDKPTTKTTIKKTKPARSTPITSTVEPVDQSTSLEKQKSTRPAKPTKHISSIVEPVVEVEGASAIKTTTENEPIAEVAPVIETTTEQTPKAPKTPKTPRTPRTPRTPLNNQNPEITISDLAPVKQTEDDNKKSADTTQPASASAVNEPVVSAPAVSEPAVSVPAVCEPVVREPVSSAPAVTELAAVITPAVTTQKETIQTDESITEPVQTQPATQTQENGKIQV